MAFPTVVLRLRWATTGLGGAGSEGGDTAMRISWPNIGLQATANSLRSCVAAAIGGA